jgi:TRAP-type mannitol/chloroaromatic compound transport system permease small subunit
MVLGVLGLVYLAALWVYDNWVTGEHARPIGTRPMLVYSAAMLGVGTQLLVLGILAELVTSYNLRPDDTFSVAERLNLPDDPPDPR